MFSPHNSKCEESATVQRRPVWEGRCSLVRASLGKYTDMGPHFPPFAKREKEPLFKREKEDSALQAADWRRNKERRKRGKNIYLAPVIRQAFSPTFF